MHPFRPCLVLRLRTQSFDTAQLHLKCIATTTSLSLHPTAQPTLATIVSALPRSQLQSPILKVSYRPLTVIYRLRIVAAVLRGSSHNSRTRPRNTWIQPIEAPQAYYHINN